MRGRMVRALSIVVAVAGVASLAGSCSSYRDRPRVARAAEGRCAGELIDAGGNTYCVYEQALGFEASQARCFEGGGRLVVIESEAENVALAGALRAGATLSGDFWLGLAEFQGEDSWQWASGALPRFGSWAPGEPNNAGGNEDCAVLLGSTGNWNDLACGTPRPYVCERTSRSDGGPVRDLSCTGTRVLSDRNEYCFYTAAPKNWSDARDACARSGAQLAELRDEGENTALREAIRVQARSDRYWIGLADIRVEGAFEWTSGEPVTFNGFGPGEPNNAFSAEASSDEDCAELLAKEGKWNDLPCSLPRASICELP